jgi:hypothetical protein
MNHPVERQRGPRVIYRDRLFEDALSVFESVIVAAAESKQHQTLAEAYNGLARMLPRLTEKDRTQAKAIIAGSLPTLSVHVATIPLRAALVQLADALREAGLHRAAKEVDGIAKDSGERSRFADEISVRQPELKSISNRNG